MKTPVNLDQNFQFLLTLIQLLSSIASVSNDIFQKAPQELKDQYGDFSKWSGDSENIVDKISEDPKLVWNIAYLIVVGYRCYRTCNYWNYSVNPLPSRILGKDFSRAIEIARASFGFFLQTTTKTQSCSS